MLRTGGSGFNCGARMGEDLRRMELVLNESLIEASSSSSLAVLILDSTVANVPNTEARSLSINARELACPPPKNAGAEFPSHSQLLSTGKLFVPNRSAHKPLKHAHLRLSACA